MTGAQPWTPPTGASGVPPVAAHDAVLIDLDGTVYIGPQPVPGAAAAIEALRADGKACCYLTNNASRTAAATAEHLRALGVPAAEDDVVTSARAAARLLAAELPAAARVLVVGGEGLVCAVRAERLQPVYSAEDAPAAVVQGFAPDVGWHQLAEGCLAVARGIPWIATNLDPTLPTPRGLVPGNGSLVAVLRAVTGARPRVAGKPQRHLVDAAVARIGARRPILVGDRLDTDIACATRAGLPSMLVLSGVTSPAQLLAADVQERPTYVAGTIDGLLVPHPDVVALDGGGYGCGAWTAAVRGGVLVLSARPGWPGRKDRYDGLRAACAAAWKARDEHGVAVQARAALSKLGLETGGCGR